MKIINRTPVHCIPNRYGGLYETIMNSDQVRINLRQVETWIEDNKLVINEKIIPHTTDIWDIEKYQVFPGNIIRVYTTDQVIEDDPEAYALYDINGIVTTPEGYIVYTYLYYQPDTTWLPQGVIDEDTYLLAPNREPS